MLQRLEFRCALTSEVSDILAICHAHEGNEQQDQCFPHGYSPESLNV